MAQLNVNCISSFIMWKKFLFRICSFYHSIPFYYRCSNGDVALVYGGQQYSALSLALCTFFSPISWHCQVISLSVNNKRFITRCSPHNSLSSHFLSLSFPHFCSFLSPLLYPLLNIYWSAEQEHEKKIKTHLQPIFCFILQPLSHNTANYLFTPNKYLHITPHDLIIHLQNMLPPSYQVIFFNNFLYHLVHSLTHFCHLILSPLPVSSHNCIQPSSSQPHDNVPPVSHILRTYWLGPSGILTFSLSLSLCPSSIFLPLWVTLTVLPPIHTSWDGAWPFTPSSVSRLLRYCLYMILPLCYIILLFSTWIWTPQSLFLVQLLAQSPILSSNGCSPCTLLTGILTASLLCVVEGMLISDLSS